MPQYRARARSDPAAHVLRDDGADPASTSTRRSSRRRASRPICRCPKCSAAPRRQPRTGARSAGTMTRLLRNPIALALARDPAADPGRQHLRDRARDQAGGDRPLRRAAAHPQPLPAGRRLRPRPAPGIAARIPFLEQIVWIDKRIQSIEMDNQQVLSTDQLPARGRCLRPLPDRRSAADVHLRAHRGECQQPARADPRLGAQERARPAAVRGPAQPRARPDDGQYPERAQPRRPPIWRRDRRRPDQACRPARPAPRSNPPSSGCAPRASRRRARSRRRATSRRRSSAPRPMPRRRRPMPAAFNQDPDFYDFYRAMQSYRISFVAETPHRRAAARAHQHHPVAQQRLSAAIPGKRPMNRHPFNLRSDVLHSLPKTPEGSPARTRLRKESPKCVTSMASPAPFSSAAPPRP